MPAITPAQKGLNTFQRQTRALHPERGHAAATLAADMINGKAEFDDAALFETLIPPGTRVPKKVRALVDVVIKAVGKFMPEASTATKDKLKPEPYDRSGFIKEAQKSHTTTQDALKVEFRSLQEKVMTEEMSIHGAQLLNQIYGKSPNCPVPYDSWGAVLHRFINGLLHELQREIPEVFKYAIVTAARATMEEDAKEEPKFTPRELEAWGRFKAVMSPFGDFVQKRLKIEGYKREKVCWEHVMLILGRMVYMHFSAQGSSIKELLTGGDMHQVTAALSNDPFDKKKPEQDDVQAMLANSELRSDEQAYYMTFICAALKIVKKPAATNSGGSGGDGGGGGGGGGGGHGGRGGGGRPKLSGGPPPPTTGRRDRENQNDPRAEVLNPRKSVVSAAKTPAYHGPPCDACAGHWDQWRRARAHTHPTNMCGKRAEDLARAGSKATNPKTEAP